MASSGRAIAASLVSRLAERVRFPPNLRAEDRPRRPTTHTFATNSLKTTDRPAGAAEAPGSATLDQLRAHVRRVKC
jgi:hypothetical protein